MTLRLALCLALCLIPGVGHVAEFAVQYPEADGARPLIRGLQLDTSLVFVENADPHEGWSNCGGITARVLSARASRYDKLIHKHARAHGVDPRLVHAVMHVESCFNPRAVSPRGARGLMQLMPAVARSLGVRNTFDPDQNIRAGVRLLRMLLDRYEGDRRLVLAAYNAGPTAVRNHRGIPPYAETRDYVARVIAEYHRQLL